MAKAIETLSIELDLKALAGGESIIEKLKSSFRGLNQIVTGNTKPAIQKLRREINDFAAKGNRSISTIDAQVTALRALRREADINSKEFKELTADIFKFERQLSKAQGRRQGAGRGGAQATQIAGAVISGGIFGGPEGALGGLGGAALGGVSGAFAGAAIGAQVGGLRRQLGEFADYAAEIKRLQIALKGITKVQDDATASQANFSRAVAAAASVTKQLNVPQEVAIRGITRLTAAVKGAGGGVADAELAFKNITSAITATGGGAEQVEGSVTALVQIFSKGKVSAEEINQIAERLPGTFNKIAEASGRTGPELTKALQKGEVGLNDLMKFLVQLGVDYSELSKKIAGSSEAAGQRLQVAYNNMRIEVGNALQPIGAEFQDAFAEFIKDITPTLVEILPKVGDFALALADALNPANSLALKVAGVATAVFLLKKAVDAYIGTKFAAIITTHIALINTMGAKIYMAAAAQGVLNAALGASKVLLASLPITAVFLGVVGLADALRQAATDQANFNKLLNEGTVDQLNNALATEKATLALERRFVAQGRGEGRAVDVSRINRSKLKIEQLEQALAEGMLGGGVLPYEQPTSLTQFPSPKPDEDKDTVKNNFADALKQAQGLELRTAKTLELARAQGAIGRVLAQQANARATLEATILTILEKSKDAKVQQATAAARGNLEEAQRLQLNQQIEAIIERSQQPLQSIIDGINQKLKSEREYAELIKSGVNPEIAQQVVQINRAHEAGLKQLETSINEFEVAKQQRELTDFELQQLDDLIRKRRVLEGLKGEATTLAFGMPAKENTKLKDFIQQSEDQLKDLQQVAVNVSQGIGNAVGNSLASGIEGLVAGTAKAKEVFANFLKDVGRVLIQEGAKMIATYIAIGVAKAFAGLLGGGSKPDIHGSNVTEVLNAGDLYNPSSSVFASPMANGGPVQSGRPYVVGERGPELFVPGATGRIDTNRDLSQMMGRSPVASSSPSMNFTFETTTIGGTEFVSREQLEDAMSMTRRQAAADGAKRGMGMTLDKIQNSPRTRSRIGIR